MRVLKFITGYMVYNLAYTYILQTTTTKIIGYSHFLYWVLEGKKTTRS